MRRVLAVLAVLVAAGALAPAAIAKVATYAVPTAGAQPWSITTAFDNASWFTERGADKVGRIDAKGHVTELALPSGAMPIGITPTPFGTLAVAANGTKTIDEVSPSGTVTTHPLPPGLAPYDVVLGNDSRIWFTAQIAPETAAAVGALSADGHVDTYPLKGEPWGMTRGNDGNVWVAERTQFGGAIARITTSGTVTEFRTGPESLPLDVAVGGDGNIWFTDQQGLVGRVKPDGSVKTFAIGASNTIFGIAKNAEDGVVVADTGSRAVYVVSKTGKARKIAMPAPPVHVDIRYPTGMWVTLQDGRIALLDDSELIPACRVPKLVGKTLARAKTLLKAADCRLGRVTKRRRAGSHGRVLKQAERAGTRLAPGYAIDLTVSR